MRFWCVATKADTGEPVYHELHDADYLDLEWIRASAAIPFFAHPVSIKGEFYFDGGVSDSIPYDFLPKHGFNKQVIITTQPKEYRKKKDKLLLIEKMVLHKYPAVIEKLKTRSEDYNAVLDRIETDEVAGKTFVIRPPYALNIGTIEKDKKEIQRVYDIGRQEAERVLLDLVEYLK